MAEDKGGKSPFDKLNGRNFKNWAYRMQLHLKMKNCWGVIDEPARPHNVSERKWEKMERKANYHISIMVEDNQLPIIKRSDSARGIWIELCKHHRKGTFSTKIRLLRKMYHEILPKHGNMENHISKMMEYYDDLREIGHVIEEQQFVSIILTSVGDDYDHLVTALDCRHEDELTLEMVKSKLLDECDRKNKNENKENTALKVQMKYCDFCKGAGHLKKSCFKFEEWLNRKRDNDERKSTEVKESAKVVMSGWSTDEEVDYAF